MPLSLSSFPGAELPIGTHGIFIKSGTQATEIGFIHVNGQASELRWHDWIEAGPIPPRAVFYVVYDHSNGNPEHTHNIWKKYNHSDLSQLTTASAPTTNSGTVWKITYGVPDTQILTDEPVVHPCKAGSNVVGYLSLKESGDMKWWAKGAAVDKNNTTPKTGLVKFNKTAGAGQRCLHFETLTAAEVEGITAERFFCAEYSPLA